MKFLLIIKPIKCISVRCMWDEISVYYLAYEVLKGNVYMRRKFCRLFSLQKGLGVTYIFDDLSVDYLTYKVHKCNI